MLSCKLDPRSEQQATALYTYGYVFSGPIKHWRCFQWGQGRYHWFHIPLDILSRFLYVSFPGWEGKGTWNHCTAAGIRCRKKTLDIHFSTTRPRTSCRMKRPKGGQICIEPNNHGKGWICGAWILYGPYLGGGLNTYDVFFLKYRDDCFCGYVSQDAQRETILHPGYSPIVYSIIVVYWLISFS